MATVTAQLGHHRPARAPADGDAPDPDLRRPAATAARQDNLPVVLILVILVFTLVFIGPMYFLFTDGLKSTQEADRRRRRRSTRIIRHLSGYVQAWSQLAGGADAVEHLVLRVRRAGLPARLRRGRRLLAVQAAAVPRQRRCSA